MNKVWLVAFLSFILFSATFTVPSYYNISNVTFAQTPPTETFVLQPTKDSFLTQGSAKNNEGTNPILRIISSDKNRPIIAFDQTEISQTVGNSELISATLRLYVTSNGNNWGTDGRQIGAFIILQD